LAPVLLPGDVITLSGDLGAGKTTFVQGVASALGVTAPVTSPTFVIIHHYEGRFPVVHMDVYRLDYIQEVLDLGFEELLQPDAVMLVEWGEAVSPLLPRRYLDVEIRRMDDGDDARRFAFRAVGREWERKLERVRVTAEALLNAASAEDSGGSRFSYGSVPRTRDHGSGADEKDAEA
ncbi:MAG: tRNA (adenosine(37)-N6)-threonylcarbamoyltransferase complex ATPase subunit type 1 TsaE, partial [Actinomycetota bacterium]|nr:tRNA (adenosine(37)-N6)-threonylcarbamoyltransferase complex ATPase subunit type 1 TsaE [Actinomycetota bacterium]